MRPGYTDSEGRTYFRCTQCGDSTNDPNKAHAFVDSRGDTWCYRCNHRGSLPMDAYIEVLMNRASIAEVMCDDWIPPQLTRMSPKQRRHTLLARYRVEENDAAEAFSMRNSTGKLIGYHTRYPNKFMVNEGQRGICWPGADDNCPLTSSATSPIMVVEGSYDVIEPNRVSAFGSISLVTMKHLKAQHLWAWPDPDIINTKVKRKRFIDMLNVANDDYCWVKGLIVSDKDPDECTVSHYVTLQQANEYVRAEYA